MRVKFWLKSALQNSLIIVGGALLYMAMMVAMEPIDSIQEVFQQASIYLLMFGAMISIMIDMSVFKLNLPLAIGFGSSRKEAFLGRQLYRLLFTAILTVGTVVLAAFGEEKGFVKLEIMAVFTPSVLLVTGSLGAMLGAASTKLGKTGVMVIGIISGVLVALLIMVCISAGITLDVKFDLPRLMIWLAPAAAAVIYGLSIIPEYKTIYNYNVKL